MAIICIGLYFNFFDKKNHTDHLIEKIDSLQNANYLLDKKIIVFQEKIDSITFVNFKKDIKIKNLKKEENEKIHSVDSLNSGELYMLFSGIKTQ